MTDGTSLHRAPRGTRGFTLLELMIVVILAVPILAAILSTTDRASRSVSATEQSSETSETARRVASRIGRIVRAASWSTFRVRATQADVDAAKASFVGEWIPAEELDPRSNIRFQSASGTVNLNATVLTSPRELEFVLDDEETANGADDDDDGLVDEGRLMLLYESARVPLASGVETCTFELDDGVLRFWVQCAGRDSSGTVHRAVAQHVWLVRNP